MEDDKFHLHRAEDGIKNLSDLSDDDIKELRFLNRANKDTGFWDTNTGNLNDDIVNLARNIGLDDDNKGMYNFSDFAKEMGMDDYDPQDLHSNEVLKQKMADKFEELKNAENEQDDFEKYDSAEDGREAFSRTLDDKDYYKNKIDDAQKKQKESKEKIKNLKNNNDSVKERLKEAKEKNKSIPRNQRSDEDNNDSKQAKKEAKEAREKLKEAKEDLKEAKEQEKNAKIDNLKSKAFMLRHPGEALALVVKKHIKKLLLKIAPHVIIMVLSFLLAIFIIELRLGPSMEAWGYIDEAITGTANFSEKVSNFYNGFGFQDSKEAFYDELDDLCDRYGCSNDGTGLDVPLILATLFYTESMGYDTNFRNIEDSNVVDSSLNGVGTNDGVFEAVQASYIKEKFDEAQQTVDENGLTYNVGKVYRLRKLARNQFHTDIFGTPTREGESKSMGLEDFLQMYGKNICKDILDLLQDLVATSWDAITAPFKELYAALLKSEYSGSFFDNTGQAATDFVHTLTQLIGDIFYGIVDITSLSFSITDGITIYYKTWKYDEENYKNYLMKYYFEYMPEFKDIIGSTSNISKENRKEQIFNEIKENKKLFEDIFLQYQNSSSENYVESCLGAINQTLVNNLNKPVDIAENFNVSFDENYSYGIVNGKNHNGVDLNSTTAGVNLGSNVYSVANGKIVSIEDSNCNDKVCGKSIKISHDINIDNETFKFFTIYSNVDIKSELKVDSTVVKGDTIGTINNSTDNTEGLHFTFLDANSDANGVAIDPTNLFIACNKATILSGNDNEEKAWNYFLSNGYTKKAAAGVMANIYAESSYITNNLENKANSKANITDEEFTSMVDSGKISQKEFSLSTTYGLYNYDYSDSNRGLSACKNCLYGYGLAQWTWPTYKYDLYEMYKTNGYSSISDIGLQLEFILVDMDDATKQSLNSSSSAEDAAEYYLLNYEKPRNMDSKINERRGYATDIYSRFANRN